MELRWVKIGAGLLKKSLEEGTGKMLLVSYISLVFIYIQ